MRLHTALLYVKDLARMATFYGDTLGLTKTSETDGWIEFDAGGTRLGLHAIPPHIEVTFDVREDTPIKLIFATDDPESLLARLEAMGLTVTRRPWNAADCIDPEGNVFQVRS